MLKNIVFTTNKYLHLAVGLSVGEVDGPAVGVSVGTPDGLFVGKAVGLKRGMARGENEKRGREKG